MKPLQITLFLLAVLVLTTQGVRHIYVRFLEPRASSLDKYDDSSAGETIRAAKKLEDLLQEYDSAKKKVEALDAERKQALAEKNTRDYEEFFARWQEVNSKTFQREEDLKKAIRDWEHRSAEIREVRWFWFVGFTLFAAGALLYRFRQEWLGLALLIPGVSEMTWWTSPSFAFGPHPVEFDRMLLNKLLFTALTLALVLGTWLLSERKQGV